MIHITYILPIRSASLTGLKELTQYLQSLDVAQLIVVDGSPAHVFSAHSKRWNDFSLHVLPDPMRDTPNGKVRGVLPVCAMRHCRRLSLQTMTYDTRTPNSCASLPYWMITISSALKIISTRCPGTRFLTRAVRS